MRAKEENELVLADLMHTSTGCPSSGGGAPRARAGRAGLEEEDAVARRLRSTDSEAEPMPSPFHVVKIAH